MYLLLTSHNLFILAPYVGVLRVPFRKLVIYVPTLLFLGDLFTMSLGDSQLLLDYCVSVFI